MCEKRAGPGNKIPAEGAAAAETKKVAGLEKSVDEDPSLHEQHRTRVFSTQPWSPSPPRGADTMGADHLLSSTAPNATKRCLKTVPPPPPTLLHLVPAEHGEEGVPQPNVAQRCLRALHRSRHHAVVHHLLHLCCACVCAPAATASIDRREGDVVRGKARTSKRTQPLPLVRARRYRIGRRGGAGKRD